MPKLLEGFSHYQLQYIKERSPSIATNGIFLTYPGYLDMLWRAQDLQTKRYCYHVAVIKITKFMSYMQIETKCTYLHHALSLREGTTVGHLFGCQVTQCAAAMDASSNPTSDSDDRLKLCCNLDHMGILRCPPFIKVWIPLVYSFTPIH